MRRHVASCPEYAVLYRTSPEKALDPEEEMEKFRLFKQSEEGQDAKADMRAERLDQWTAFQETKAEQALGRWNTPGAGSKMVATTLRPDEVLALDGARMYGERIAPDEPDELTPTQRIIRRGFVGGL
jgi:hypothetical protein